MGPALRRETLYVEYILLTKSKHQALALLEIPTLRQAKAISEIVYNVLQDSFSNTDDVKRKLAHHVEILRLLSAKRFPLAARRSGIINSSTVVYKLLLSVKDQLLQVLRSYTNDEGVGSDRED